MADGIEEFQDFTVATHWERFELLTCARLLQQISCTGRLRSAIICVQVRCIAGANFPVLGKYRLQTLSMQFVERPAC